MAIRDLQALSEKEADMRSEATMSKANDGMPESEKGLIQLAKELSNEGVKIVLAHMKSDSESEFKTKVTLSQDAAGWVLEHITALEAERNDLLRLNLILVEQRDELKREVESHLEVERLGLKVHRDAMAVICKQYEEQKAKAEKYEKALREIAKFWFDPTDDKRGVCGCCAGGLMFKPEQKYMEHHEKDCPFDIAKSALSESAAQEGEK